MVSGNCCGVEKIFDSKEAAKLKKKYLKKGPRGVTRVLVQLLDRLPKEGKSLLDIGGGVGALQWHFLENGGESSTDIDASEAYLKTAEELSQEKGLSDRTKFVLADIACLEDIGPHQYVTLDKVVCCYPDYKSLLEKATGNCTETLALSMPVSNMVSRAISKMTNVWLSYIKRSPFRMHIHQVKEIDAFIESKGFKLIDKKLSFPWWARVYGRG